jgi:hypothetical protein
MTDRLRRIIELRKEGMTRAEIAGELGCSVPTVARDLATLRRAFGLPADLMQLSVHEGIEQLRAAEAAGRYEFGRKINGPGAMAVAVYKTLLPEVRAVVRQPGLKALADSIRHSKSTAHRTMQKLRREAGRLPPPDRIRSELRTARNALKRARRLLEADDWAATDAAWSELADLKVELEELDEVTG